MTPASTKDAASGASEPGWAVTHDLRDLMNMRSATARWVVVAYACAIGTHGALLITRASALWTVAAVVVIGGAAGLALVTSPGDPLPLRWTIPICLTPALLGWVSLQGGPMVVELSEGWGRGIGVPLLCFMCVLGRTRYAWPGFLAVVAVFAIHYAHSIGPLAGAARCLTDGAVLAIATVFAVTIRPTAQTIFALRAAGARRAAEVAAREATAIERDSQLSELDTLARPLLARIASGAALSAAERLQCELLDAELRDRLRAPGLHSAAVAAAAARARARGVDVILIDDRGDAPLSSTATTAIRRAVVAALDQADTGDIHIRLLPAGRSAAASVLWRGVEHQTRCDLADDGSELHPENES